MEENTVCLSKNEYDRLIMDQNNYKNDCIYITTSSINAGNFETKYTSKDVAIQLIIDEYEHKINIYREELEKCDLLINDRKVEDTFINSIINMVSRIDKGKKST